MSEIKNLLCLLLNRDIDSVFIKSNFSIDWSETYKLSAAQGVTAIVWDKVQTAIANGELHPTHQPAKTLKIQWAINVERIEAKYAKQKEVIAKLASFLAKHNIKMMIIKGYGLSLNYPIPNHRPCGDIDIWLFEEEIGNDGQIYRKGVQQKADNLLREHFNLHIDEDKHHHTVFYIDGVMVENHYDFLNIHAHRSNRIIEQRLQQFVQQDMEVVDVDSVSIYLPPPDFHALFLLRHTAAHFAAESIGLRHLFDWSYFVDKYSAQIDWKTLTDLSVEMNMHRFLNCLNAICVDFLDLSQDKIPTFKRDKALENRFLEEILHPEFNAEKPQGAGYFKSWIFMFHRWWANRWKHRIVYCEGLWTTFFIQVWSHILKPKSLKLH